jgi:hypothetical protein
VKEKSKWEGREETSTVKLVQINQHTAKHIQQFYASSLLREYQMCHLFWNLGFIGENKRYNQLRWNIIFCCT